MVKNPPAIQEMQVRSLGQEDTLEEVLYSLLYSFMENPLNRGAWETAVHGVTKSGTELK